jgi:hypothetical protein
MREVIRGFRLKVRLIEKEAAEEIDKALGSPTLDPRELEARNKAIVEIVTAKMKEAMAEGGKFGKFVAKKI